MCFEQQTNLENQCSLLYTANTEQPFAIGEWRFLGPTNHTSTYEQRVNKNLAQWDSTRLPRENMECILECSFPTPSEASSSQYEIECAICYSYQLDVQGRTLLPEKMCPNEKISLQASVRVLKASVAGCSIIPVFWR